MTKYFYKRFVIAFVIVVVVGSSEESRPKSKVAGQGPSGHPIYQFASRILNQVALERSQSGNGQSNILISPFSIRTALAIVYLGANGRTAEEIQKALMLPNDRKQLVESLSKQLNTLSLQGTSTLKIGNGLFLDKSITVNDSLANELKSRLGATVQTLDFKNDPSYSSQSINSWISSITQGKIQDMVTPSAISVSKFLLANALFYQGQWTKPFTVLPNKGTFRKDSGQGIPVTMMGLESTFGYSYIPELKSTGISVPFKDDRFEFIILKPDDGQNVDSVRPLLINYPLDKLSFKLGENLRTVTLTLPKFTLKANYDTIETMKKLGITSLFDGTQSDLSNLAQIKGGKSSRSPFVSRMVHQTLLDINELGATGAAGTVVSGYPISVSSSLDVDKPFLFLLSDRLTGPLLIGQLSDPRQ